MKRGMTFMEVCGSHTMAIARHGLRALFPEGVRMVSGPGCPVCVTPVEDIDRAIAVARLPGVIVATFGDMVRVPGSESSLEQARAEGADVRIVYSPADALALAEEFPRRTVIFVGVGFETTAPAVAATLVMAKKRRIANFFVLSFFKTVPNALQALLAHDADIDGFLLPGHVSAIIGSHPYEFLATDHQVPGVIAGFEPDDILRSVRMLAAMVSGGDHRIVIDYKRVVRPEGNPAARAMMASVFSPGDARWRGIGTIASSGLVLSSAYSAFDAREIFPVELPAPREHPGCLCGEVMLGRREPDQCPQFARECDPSHPSGPCMVSSEGACAAAYNYGPRVRKGSDR